MLEKVISELKQSKIIKTHRGASQGEIDSVARQLAVEFPPRYVEFLLRYGTMDVYDTNVFGLGPDTRRYEESTVSFQTWYARGDPLVRLPPYLVAIWHDCHNDYQCLDTRHIRRGDCPVVYYDMEIAASRRPKARVVTKGFHEWLRIIVAKQLEAKARVEAAEPVRPRKVGKRRGK